jgi:hypothetical protein
MAVLPEEPPPVRRGARVASWIVLGLLNLAGVLSLLFAWGVLTIDPHDRDAPAAAAVVALFAIALAGLTALLTGIAVLARWVGRRWFLGPALITVAGFLLCYGGEAVQSSRW